MFGYEAPLSTSVCRCRSSFQDEFHEGCPKSVVVPKTINAVRQLILQDRHMTYREIETTLGISGTSIHSIFQEHLAVKKICSRCIPYNSINRSKKSINQSGNSASTIGSNACKSALILMGNILKNNQAIFDD